VGSIVIPLLGLSAGLYLVWLTSWLVGRPRVQVVTLRHRSLHRATGYPAELIEGQANGRRAHAARHP
jgi:hypothetical protein